MQTLKLNGAHAYFKPLTARSQLQRPRIAVQVQRSFAMVSSDLKERLATLHKYSACDVCSTSINDFLVLGELIVGRYRMRC